MRPRHKMSKKGHERTQENGSLYFIQNEKLRLKNFELKHRLCLLEYGIGMMATIFEEHVQTKETNQAEPSKEKDTANDGHGESAIQNIGKVLFDIEEVLKSVAVPNGQIVKSEVVTQMTAPQSLQWTSAVSGKPRIFIDEMESGKNSSSGLCNIQVVENSTIASFPDLPLESPSTLASAAVVAKSNQNVDYNVPPKKRRIVTNGMAFSSSSM